MLPLRIAGRFLRANPWQSAFIALGIAVGIATQLFVALLITSLQANLVDTVVGNAPQVTIVAAEDGEPIAWQGELRDTVREDPGVKTAIPVRLGSALYFDGTTSAPLSITGGQLSDLDAIYDITGRLIEGKAPEADDEIVVGTDFAEEYALAPRDEISLAFAGSRPVTATISGVIDLGSAEANLRSAFSGGELLADALGLEDREYSAVQAQLDDPFASGEVASRWREKLEGVDVVDWQEQSADLLEALAAQSASSYMIQAFVLVAVAIGIASTLAISAVQKTRQIGILKALGMGDGATGLVFLWEGAILGTLGTLLGIGLGIGLAALFLVIPVPFGIDLAQPALIGISAAVGIGVSLASAVVPLRKTARLDAIEVIQNG